MDEQWNYIESVEREIDKIRSEALAKVRLANPYITHVIDPYTFDDYCRKSWDYPGAWYCYFQLPNGITSRQQLIATIVAHTLAHY